MTSLSPISLRAFVGQIDTSAGPDGCWPWRGPLTRDGYGRFGRPARLAHRLAYELMRRPIPEGFVIDHLCRNRRCVNPVHMEAVKQRENILRSPHTMPNRNAAKTHCPQGHPYSPENTYQTRTRDGRRRRECRACRRERARSKREVLAS